MEGLEKGTRRVDAYIHYFNEVMSSRMYTCVKTKHLKKIKLKGFIEGAEGVQKQRH